MQNKRKKRLNIYKRDNLIVDILKNHMGSENGIEGAEICKILSDNGFSIKKTHIRNEIERIRKERHLPIWYKKGCGFFWFGRAEEVKEAIAKLNSTINTLQDTIELLQRFIFEQRSNHD